MQEQELLGKMISPNMRRPSIWLNGVMQIWVTRACDLGCCGCTQGSNLGGKPGRISVDQFEQAVRSLTDYFGVVGIFGGNPALHPQFNELCTILRNHIPHEQRGLWCNHPRGNGVVILETFNPKYSNLNVHLVRDAYDEFVDTWPECRPYLKGLDPEWPEAKAMKKNNKEYKHRVGDARHAPPYIAMQDLDQLPFPDGSRRPNTEENRNELISTCDINKYWSAMICVFRDELRGFFCEIAGAQAMLHQLNSEYPDTGVPITQDWWKQSMSRFADQVRHHCHACGIPLRASGSLAIGGTLEQVSATHVDIFKPKSSKKSVELVQLADQLANGHVPKVTDYVENGGGAGKQGS